MKRYEKFVPIILLIMSITLIAIGIFTKNIINKSMYIIFGELFCIFGIITSFIDSKDEKPKRGFELVSKEHKKTQNEHIILPKRATKNSAAYDFYSNEDCAILPNGIVKLWTDVKVYMQPDEFLMLDVRSSMGGRFMLANTIGIVDSDYYNNEDNEGNIGIFLKNISDDPQIIHVGDKIGQGLFVKYLTTDDDKTTKIRKGGFGSTND